MLGIGKNIGLLLLSITVIFAGTTFTLALDADESLTSDSGFVQGHTTLTVYDENGYVKSYAQSDNAIVQNGMTTLVQETFGLTTEAVTGDIGASTGPVSHMGIGTGSLAAVGSDSTLTTITGCVRQAATFTSAGAGASGNFATITVRASATFSGGTVGSSCSAVADITEAGMFNAAGSAGEMFARNAAFAAVTELGATDTLDITWDFTFTGIT